MTRIHLHSGESPANTPEIFPLDRTVTWRLIDRSEEDGVGGGVACCDCRLGARRRISRLTTEQRRGHGGRTLIAEASVENRDAKCCQEPGVVLKAGRG